MLAKRNLTMNEHLNVKRLIDTHGEQWVAQNYQIAQKLQPFFYTMSMDCRDNDLNSEELTNPICITRYSFNGGISIKRGHYYILKGMIRISKDEKCLFALGQCAKNGILTKRLFEFKCKKDDFFKMPDWKKADFTDLLRIAISNDSKYLFTSHDNYLLKKWFIKKREFVC